MTRKKLAQLGALLITVVFLTGCAGTGISWPNAPKNEPRPQFSKHEIIEVKPETVSFALPNGQQVTAQVQYSKRHELAVNAVGSTQAKGSFWSWLLNPFVSGWLWLLVAVLVFVPGAMSLFTFGAGRVRKRMGQVVGGVENFLRSDAPQEIKDKLLAELRGSSDTDTKKEISELKRKVV